MRISRLLPVLVMLALLCAGSRAQDAVLVLSPSSSASVRAGTGSAGFGGDGESALRAQLSSPSAMAQDSLGNLFIADTRNHRVRRVTPEGTITSIAGTGVEGFSGDGGAAVTAQLDSPAGVAVATDGTLFIADTRNARIRSIDSQGVMHTIAGSGVAGFGGDGGKAVSARLSSPLSVTVGLTGDLYIADAGNHRVRHVDASGNIATVAGDGSQGSSRDGTPATLAHLDSPSAIAVRTDGSVLIADRRNNRIVLLRTDGALQTLTTAQLTLRLPTAVAVDAAGDAYVADSGNHRVAQVSSVGAASVLGSGEQGQLSVAVAPGETPLGTPAAVLADIGNGDSTQITMMDRENSQVVQVNRPTISFPDTVLATTSAARSLLLRNAGRDPLTIAALTIPAPFATATTGSCGIPPFQLPTGASCSIDLVFQPVAATPVSGLAELQIQKEPSQRVLLTGSGLASGTQLASSVSLQPSSTITYASSPVTLLAQVLGSSVTTPSGQVAFLDSNVELGRVTLNASAQATYTTTALLSGVHAITVRYLGDKFYRFSESQEISLLVSTPPDFTMSTPAGSRVLLQGSNPGAFLVTLQPVSGVLNQKVTVTVDGLPSGATINVSPAPVILASDPVPITIAFKMPVRVAVSAHDGLWFAALPALFCALPRRYRTRTAALSISACVPLFLLQGCGGGYLSGASVTAQSATSTYPVTVVATCTGATGAALTHSVTFTVVVQP